MAAHQIGIGEAVAGPHRLDDLAVRAPRVGKHRPHLLADRHDPQDDRRQEVVDLGQRAVAGKPDQRGMKIEIVARGLLRGAARLDAGVDRLQRLDLASAACRTSWSPMPTSMMRRKPWMSRKDERETSICAAKKFWIARALPVGQHGADARAWRRSGRRCGSCAAPRAPCCGWRRRGRRARARSAAHRPRQGRARGSGRESGGRSHRRPSALAGAAARRGR